LSRRGLIAVAVLGLLPLLPLSAHASKPAAVAPTFSLPALHGTASLDSLRGRVVLVDFWASWCVPCRGSFPWMASLSERYRDRGLAIVAVNLDKDRALADRFLAEHPAPFTVAFDPAGETAEAYHVRAMPTSVLVGADGHVLLTHIGFDPKHSAEVEARIEEALPK